MRHVYRRPFDYSVPRRFYNVWQATNAIEAVAGSATFTTYQASVSGSGVSVSVSGRGASRFAASGVFRKRWNYAQINARIELIYIEESFAVTAAGDVATFVGYPATVALGSSAATDIPAGADALAFTAHVAAVDLRSVINETRLGYALFSTNAATISGVYGLGVSRTGPTQVSSSGTYSSGTVRTSSRTAVTSTVNNITRSK